MAWSLSRRHPRRGAIRPSLLLWTTWLAVATVTFAAMAGIFHSYYTVVVAPAIAALVAIGSWLAWERRDDLRVRRRLSSAALATALLASGTLLAVGAHLRWTAVPVLLGGVAAALLLHPRSGPPRVTVVVGCAAVVSALAGPALFATETVRLPHSGSGPMAGPSAVHPSSSTAPSAAAVSRVAADGESYTWVAAAMGARTASAYQLALDEPVLAIGGYKGTDPLPTLSRFQDLVAAGQVHWLISGGTEGEAGRAIERWVTTHFPSVLVDGQTLYDLGSGAGADPDPSVGGELLAGRRSGA